MAVAPDKLHALLLLGGGGTRLWPVSTTRQPKQFLPLLDKKSIFQLTLERAVSCGVTSIYVVTNEHYFELARQQSHEVSVKVSFILEPMRRDSAAAIASGVAALKGLYGDDAIVAVLPCDHLIPDHSAFSDALRDAIDIAMAGYLVTFGIAPSSPSCEYGYIRQGDALTLAKNVFRVDEFHEKPNLETAISYLASGEYHWNSGIFLFRVIEFCNEAQKHMPQIWRIASKAFELSIRETDIFHLDSSTFSGAEQISIDYALFEKSNAVAVLPRNFAWSDVGSWSSVYANLPHNSHGNAIVGEAVVHECHDTLVYSKDLKVIAVGLEDVVIVASTDGVFVAAKGRSAELKKYL